MSENAHNKKTHQSDEATTMNQEPVKVKILFMPPWLFICIVFAIGIIPYIINFYHHSIANSPDKWGAFGDYLGGILNPVISAMALFFLVKAYQTQLTELANTRRALVSAAESSEASAKALDLQNQNNALNIRINLLSTKISFHQKSIEIYRNELSDVVYKLNNSHTLNLGPQLLNSFITEITQRKDRLNAIIKNNETKITELSHEFDAISTSLYSSSK